MKIKLSESVQEKNKIINEKRLACETFGKSKTTLYNINNHYYCRKCKEGVKND